MDEDETCSNQTCTNSKPRLQNNRELLPGIILDNFPQEIKTHINGSISPSPKQEHPNRNHNQILTKQQQQSPNSSQTPCQK